jgi:hypothetical protein
VRLCSLSETAHTSKNVREEQALVPPEDGFFYSCNLIHIIVFISARCTAFCISSQHLIQFSVLSPRTTNTNTDTSAQTTSPFPVSHCDFHPKHIPHSIKPSLPFLPTLFHIKPLGGTVFLYLSSTTRPVSQTRHFPNTHYRIAST